MNTNNPKYTKWVKRISGSLIAIMLAISSGGNAYARILFEDDEFFNIQSEGIILDQNDNLTDGTLSTNTYTMADAACLVGETYTATINGTAVVYTATTADCAGDNTADTAAILQGLTAAIDADYTVGHIVDAAYSANTITVTATVADPSNNYTTTAADTSTGGTLVATGANLAGGVLGDTVDLQFGNDGTDALISYDPNNQNLTLSAPGGTFDFSDDNLRTTGAVELQGSSEFHIREVANEAAATCTTVGEIVLDTGENRIYVCTATGSPGTWAASDSGSSQDFDDVYDISQSGANLTMEIDNGSLNFNITTADSFTIQDGGVAIAEFTGAGAVEFDPTSGQNFDVTTLGVGDVLFTTADAFDVNAAGAVGIDSDTTVTIGGASIGITADGGILGLTGDGTNDIDILNAGAAIDIDSATLDILTSGVFSIDGTGASNVSATSGNLTLSTITSGDVAIGAADDVTITAGDDIIFDDAQLVGIVQMTDTATDWAATFSTDGIIDNINSFTLFTAGDGADNVGVEDASLPNIAAVRADLTNQTITYTADTGGTGGNAITVTLVETAPGDLGGDGATIAVTAIGNAITVTFQDDNNANPETVGQQDIVECINSAVSIITSGSGATAGDGIACTITNDVTSLVTAAGGTATTDAVALGSTSLTGGLVAGLPNSSTVQDALERMDLQFGDLFSEIGATLIGIEDPAGNFTATDVEGALTELAGDIGKNFEDLTFYPEYPDTVIDADGSNNRGTLESFYDGSEESGYYNWTTNNGITQDIDLHFAFPMPTDFVATGDFTFRYRTGTVTEADNDVEVVLYNVTDSTTCASDLTNGTAGTWATGTITAASINAGCTLDAGDIVEVRIKLYDNVGVADYSDVGVLIWNYTK